MCDSPFSQLKYTFKITKCTTFTQNFSNIRKSESIKFSLLKVQCTQLKQCIEIHGGVLCYKYLSLVWNRINTLSGCLCTSIMVNWNSILANFSPLLYLCMTSVGLQTILHLTSTEGEWKVKLISQTSCRIKHQTPQL